METTKNKTTLLIMAAGDVYKRQASLRYLIELYQALGGGWPVGEF